LTITQYQFKSKLDLEFGGIINLLNNNHYEKN
jgi:hypothetical protein